MHEVQAASKLGWSDLDDGPLLDAMAGRFDVLVTVDKSLPKQQRLKDRPFAVIVLRAKTNRLADLFPLVPALLHTIEVLRPGQIHELFG
jgi:hypothetical protein